MIMASSGRRKTTASLVTLVALLAAACTNPSGTATGSTQDANVNATGIPTSGGTLRIVGNADVDHLDTASAYYTTSYALERTFTRQLFSYPATTDQNLALQPEPDVATDVPTMANGGISPDGKTITVRLSAGAQWNTTPARPVTAEDFVRGFKRLCNPTRIQSAPPATTRTPSRA
jgi:ABC-type transport system substrate-binding protein